MTNITEVRNTSSALHLLNTELWSSMVGLRQRELRLVLFQDFCFYFQTGEWRSLLSLLPPLLVQLSAWLKLLKSMMLFTSTIQRRAWKILRCYWKKEPLCLQYQSQTTVPDCIVKSYLPMHRWCVHISHKRNRAHSRYTFKLWRNSFSS